MNRREAKRIACGLASDLLNSELSNQAMWTGMNYSEHEMLQIHSAFGEIVCELDRRRDQSSKDNIQQQAEAMMAEASAQ